MIDNYNTPIKAKLMQLIALPVMVAFLVLLSKNLIAQEHAITNHLDDGFQTGGVYFDYHLYAHSADVFNRKVETPTPQPFNNQEKLRRDALLTAQISNVRLEDPKAAARLEYYINEFYPDPITIQPILELGSNYYYNKNYDKAIKWYNKVNLKRLPELDESEASFKKGYCHFVKKEFDQALRVLGVVKDYRNIFYYPSNYYYGMSQYFKGDFKGAVTSFKKVSNSNYYGDFIPYYLSQIYFAQDQHDLLLSYGEQKVTEPNVKNKKEIRLLLGQAYYIRQDFERALKHLEFYEANTDKLTTEEFYQLAFTQYKLEKYAKAKDNFQELTYLDSKLGQLANYYLADCYIKLDDKASARSIFKKVSQMDYDKGMQEEAYFNYGKISAEFGSEREAINILTEVKTKSPYYKESQDVIYDLLVNSADFVNSINIIESLPSLTEKIKTIYQSLCLKYALQTLKANNLPTAETYFNKSLLYKKSRLYEAQTYYWLGKMAYDNGDLNGTTSLIDQYHEVANGLNDLPEESAGYMANYLAAYANLKTGKLDEAVIDFKNSIVGININQDYISSEYITKRVLPDASLRASDCLFKLRKYEEALVFYERSIKLNSPGKIYAMYQKGIIEGLLNQPYKKIVSLEKITTQYPDSEYGDDAYNQIGETYFNNDNADPAAIAYIDLMARYGQKSPYYNNAVLKLGLINYNRGDTDKAMEYYKSVFNYNPSPKQKVEAMKAIEEIYVKNGDSDGYFTYLDSIPGFNIGEFSKDSLTYHIAYQQYSIQDYERSLSSFDKYIQRYPNGFYKTNARYYRAEIHTVNKSYENALLDYESVILDDTSSPHYQNALRKAAILTSSFSRNFNKSLRYFTTLVELEENPEDIYAAELGAMTAAYEMDAKKDIIIYANRVSSNPLATKEERTTALFYIGKTAHDDNNMDQALAAFTQMSQSINDAYAAEAKYLISEIYFNKGQFDLSEKQCNFNNESSLNYPYWVAKSILLLSDIYLERDDLINARAAIEAVIDNFSDDNELLLSANRKLAILESKEIEANRIKIVDPNIIELDTTGGK